MFKGYSNWKKSSFGSGDENELRVKIVDGVAYLSKDDWPVTIQVGLESWNNFLKGVKNGDFD